MGTALQVTELTNVAHTDTRETYQFCREDEAYPYVDVSFILRPLKPGHPIVTDGPYRLQPLSPGSRVLYRERPSSGPKAEFSINVRQEMREEVAGQIAELLFGFAAIQDLNTQEK